MLFSRLFAKSAPLPAFSPDIAGDESSRLAANLRACANRRGGALKNARRAEALTGLFAGLSPTGKRVFAEIIDTLNDDARESMGEQYAEIEEAELFGGSDSKLAVLDMFETPRRRVLNYMSTTVTGPDALRDLREFGGAAMRNEIDSILTEKR